MADKLNKDSKEIFSNQVNKEKKKVVDISFSMRRNTRQPLEENSVVTDYNKLKEEMANSKSSIYKGQIVVTQGISLDKEGNEIVNTSPQYFSPYLIKNDSASPTTYYADRIFTQSYMNEYIANYVKKGQLGTLFTGVGQWADVKGRELATSTYSEIFNDYANKVDNGAKYAHVEGFGNKVSGDVAHAEGHKVEASGTYSHVEGTYSKASGFVAHAEGDNTNAIGDYSHTQGTYTIASEKAATAIGDNTIASGTNSLSTGKSTYASGINSTTFGNLTKAEAENSIAGGLSSDASGKNSIAIGNNTKASEENSSAFGDGSIASGISSHAEGSSTASGMLSHAEGSSTTASGSNAHAEGNKTIAAGVDSHAEGTSTKAQGKSSHAEGNSSTTVGNNAHAEGNDSHATNDNAHAEGLNTNAIGAQSHSEGNATKAQGINSHAENFSTIAAADSSHTEGVSTTTTINGTAGHAEGDHTKVSAIAAHAEGIQTLVDNGADGSHTEGYKASTFAPYSHAEGDSTQARGKSSHAEGLSSKTVADYAHAEGNKTIATGVDSHAEGASSEANGNNSHAEGDTNIANGESSHAEGMKTHAEGGRAHAEGDGSTANGQASHAEGYATIAGQADENNEMTSYNHAEGWKTIAGGNWAHSEGESTSAYGRASHTQGQGSNAVGVYSSATGFYSETFNSSETSLGCYNRSYTSSLLGSGTKITDMENTFAQLGGKYIPGRIPSESGHRDGKYYFDNSYETLFTIGDGTSDGRTDNINPLNMYDEDGRENPQGKINAGKYVQKTGRHNIMDIRKNGQMYYSGGMIVGGEIVGPASYSYVASLGPTAYFTTIMAALLTQPEYYRPYLQYIFNDDSKNTSDGKEIHVEVGSTTNYNVKFYANRVAFNTLQQLDPIYGTSLGNMLGYSTGIKDIKYLYYDASKKIPSQQTASNLTEVDLTFQYWTSTNGDYEGYLAGKVNHGKELAGGKSDTFAYNYKTANVSTETYSSGNKVTVGLNCGTEDTYTIFKFQSYTFDGASQMYFQQLADKGTYIGAAGQKPLEKFNEETFNASGTVVVKAYYKFYYGNSDLDYSALESSFKNGQLPNGYNSGECTFQGAVGSTNEASLGIGANGTMACWVAVPAGLYELAKYKSGQSGYMWYKNAMNAESALDTGLITDSVSSARPLYDFITEKPIGACGLKYHVYIVYVPKRLTQGTWWFKIKRNAGHETDKPQTIPAAKLINKEEKKQVKLTFESNADTTIPVYYTKESFINGTPDKTISLKANERKITTIDKPEIYRFGVTQYDPITLKYISSNTAITFVGIKGTVLDGYRLFDRASNLKETDLTYLDTSKMTDMKAMFQDCHKLTTLDLSHFDTSNVIDMEWMFTSCSNLTTLDLSYFDTSNVIDMEWMFNLCSSLTTLDVSKWDTSKVTNMSGMFNNCSGLTSLNVSNWDTSNVTSMGSMFYNCSSLTTLDVSNWNVSNVTNMDSMFNKCSNLTTLDVSKWNTSKVTRMTRMFCNCQKLTTIGSVDTAPGWKHTPDKYDNMFYNCPATPKPSWYHK